MRSRWNIVITFTIIILLLEIFKVESNKTMEVTNVMG